MDIGRNALTDTKRIRDDYTKEWNSFIYYKHSENEFQQIYLNSQKDIEFKNYEILVKETNYIFVNLQPDLDFIQAEEIISKNENLSEKIKFVGGIIASQTETANAVQLFY